MATHIKLNPEPVEFMGTPAENCIFCDQPTRHWNLKTNRPICVLCATLHKESDIPNAKFNY